MGLLQAVSSSESSLEINGRLIAKNGFSSLITRLHHTMVSFSFFIDLFQPDKIHLSPPNSPF